MLVAYFGIEYILAVFAMWGAFSVACGCAMLWLVRRYFIAEAVWYGWGLFGAVTGAIAFPFLFPSL